MVNSVISLRLRRTLKRAGLDYLVGHFTPHTFRHMYASYLLNSGIPVSEVSASLGHSSPQMTLSIYTERNPDDDVNLADKFNELW
ncbi:tyrosine-type recombinase/integrase [Fructilactobacillus florum]|uniref:tyrosine-type recombinase/integrase n=1 Tax=Fructilactobacillus florum TaxID=640331 RepID=UPI000A5B07AF